MGVSSREKILIRISQEERGSRKFKGISETFVNMCGETSLSSEIN